MPVNILDPWMLVLSAGIYKRAFPRERLCKSWAEELLGFSFCIFFFLVNFGFVKSLVSCGIPSFTITERAEAT